MSVADAIQFATDADREAFEFDMATFGRSAIDGEGRHVPLAVFDASAPLAVDQRPDWKRDQDETSRIKQQQITPDNFEQVLADVLADMNADDAAIAPTTQEDDEF